MAKPNTVTLNYKDFSKIIELAVGSYTDTLLPMTISDIKLDPQEVIYVIVMNALISKLNQELVLNKLVVFDITTPTKDKR